MSSGFMQLAAISVVLMLVQALAALPWLFALLRRPLREYWPLLAVAGGAGLILALFLDIYSDPTLLARAGRVYMAALHLQVGADLFVVAFWLLLTFWSKGGAVALASFQEGVRQPMFWLLTFAGTLIMFLSVFIPYFTFGEDLKMVKELCYAFTMLGPAIFGVIAACTSVSEEIEGRTAVTLMSKPISRRQFLLGKFVGITLAGALMTVILGWVLVWVILYKTWYESSQAGYQDPGDPSWVLAWASSAFDQGSAAELTRGLLLWVHDAGVALPGLIIGFGQAVILTAVAIALATRLPMVVNLTMCLLVYLLGHLTPIMTEVTRRQNPLVFFVAQVFDTILPGLDLFDIGSTIIRDTPLDPVQYAIYTVNVSIYALTFTAIALLLGLVLFEDRDLA